MQWKNEFEGLEETISTLMKVPPFDSAQGRLRNKGTKVHEVVLEQVRVAKKNISTVAFGIVKPKHRCVYIRRHQQVLVRMWDALFDLTAEDAETQRTQSEHLHQCFEELHEFLMSEFPDCFDLAMIVPAGYLEKVREEFKIDINSIHAIAVRRKAPKELMLVIVDPYKAIIDGRPVEWNYQKIKWLKRFVTTLEERMPPFDSAQGRLRNKDTRNKHFYTPLIKQLVYYNYNSIDFKNWLIGAIYEDVDETSKRPGGSESPGLKATPFDKGGTQDPRQTIERLSYHLNEMNKIPVKERSSYSLNAKSVKEDVCDVLTNELEHMKDQYKLPLLTAVQLKDEKVEKNARDAQRKQSEELPGIFFGTSVTELGLFINVLQKVGLIRNENMRPVAEFLAMYCRSIGREQFSAVNLYKAFSAKNKNDLESLDSKLTDAVNLLRKWKRK